MPETRPARGIGGRLTGLLLIAPPVLVVAGLILLPAISASLSTLEGPDGWSLTNYAAFFHDAEARANLLITLWTTLVTTTALMLFCLPLALYLRFHTGRIAAFVLGLGMLPLFVPAILVCYALIRFVGPNGILAAMLAHAGIGGYATPYLTQWGPVTGLFWEGIPLTLLILLAGLGQVPSAAIEAARDVGAGMVSTVAVIVVPLIRRSLLVAFALDFLAIFGSFTTPYLLGPASPEMMGVYMQRTFLEIRDPTRAQTQAVVSFLICALVGAIYVRGTAQTRRQG